MDIQRWIQFDDFVTPNVITIIYVLGVIAISLFSLFILLGGGLMGAMGDSGGFGFLIGLVTAVLVFVLGNLLLRVYCEILIVIFKIHGHLKSIDEYFIVMKRNS